MQGKKEKAIVQAIGKAIAKKQMEKGLMQENVAKKLTTRCRKQTKKDPDPFSPGSPC